MRHQIRILKSAIVLVLFIVSTAFSFAQQVNAPIQKVTSAVDNIEFVLCSHDKGIEINWVVDGENDIRLYEIHRANADMHFAPIAWVSATPENLYHEQYLYIDDKPLSGPVYYRIALHDYQGICEYTEPQMIDLGITEILAISVWPNPTLDNQITVSISGIALPVTGTLTILNPEGERIFSEWVELSPDELFPIVLTSTKNGPYKLQFINNAITLETILMVIDESIIVN